MLDKNNDNCIDMPETDLGIDTLQKKMYSSLHKKRGVHLCGNIELRKNEMKITKKNLL